VAGTIVASLPALPSLPGVPADRSRWPTPPAGLGDRPRRPVSVTDPSGRRSGPNDRQPRATWTLEPGPWTRRDG